MKLHCLGTTGFHPSSTRHTACYYIPELELVLDAGSGIFRLTEFLLKDPKQSLTILLSHAHLDHIVGLTFLVDALAVTSLERIRIIGEKEKLNAIREHLYHELLFPVAPASMEFVALESPSGSTSLPKCEMDWFPLEHPGGSIGFCIKAQGKRLAYVTDTIARPNSSYLACIKDLDLLLHECYFGDEHQELAEKTGHSWLAAVSQIVRRIRPKKTALIHINPLAELLNNGFSLSSEHTNELHMTLAEDGMEFDF